SFMGCGWGESAFSFLNRRDADQVPRSLPSSASPVLVLDRTGRYILSLASRSFHRRLRDRVLEGSIRDWLELQGRKGVRSRVSGSETSVVVDPGELDAILLNLITSSFYWLDRVPKDRREIEFRLTRSIREPSPRLCP